MTEQMTIAKRANIPIIMALLAVLAVAAAIWTSTTKDGDQQTADAGSLMLPEFRAVVAEVTSVSLRSPDGGVTLRKHDDGWQISERAGYPADTSKVNGILLGLARARLEERKTGDSVRLQKIGLGDAATVIELSGSDGAPMLVLKTGNNTTRGADRQQWTFVMRDADTHAWLVSGLPEISIDPADYINKTASRISSLRVGRIEVSHSSGDSYTLSRSDPLAEFTVDQVGEGENFFAPEVAAATAAALDGLQADDVAPRAADAGDPLATMVYYMWDGLRVHLRLYEESEGMRWITLDASYDATAAMAADAPQVMLDAPPDGAAEADNLNAQWARWQYKIPSGFGDEGLARPRSDFISSKRP